MSILKNINQSDRIQDSLQIDECLLRVVFSLSDQLFEGPLCGGWSPSVMLSQGRLREKMAQVTNLLEADIHNFQFCFRAQS